MFDTLLRKIVEIGFNVTIMFTFLALVLIKDDPIHVLKGAFQELVRNKKFYFYAFGTILIYFIINITETKFDIFISRDLIRNDFTHLIYAIEGDFIAKFQNILRCNFLTILLTYIYIFTFPIQFFLALIIYVYKRMYNLIISTVVALGLNYVFVLPFYIFFPVQEVWLYNSEKVEFLAPIAYPYISMDYRNMSGIDNCFPSFHTSMAVTMIILAHHSKIKSLYYLTLVLSVLTIISTMYLGIHWITDVVAGVIVAVVATIIGINFGEKKAKNIEVVE